MAVVTMKQLLEAGVHFGHQTRRWNPKMQRFIFGERNGIYIIDLNQTLERINTAYTFVRDMVADGGTILFVGTKKQTQDPIADHARKCGMPFINERWLGGMLTNFSTISARVKKMQEYERMKEAGDFEAMPKKEALILSRELEKLQRNLGGIRNLAKLPDAVFIIDTKKEHIAVTEANKLGHADRGRGRHQLRPRPDPVRDPRQRRRHPGRQPDVPHHLRRGRGGPPHRLPPPRQGGGRVAQAGGRRPRPRGRGPPRSTSRPRPAARPPSRPRSGRPAWPPPAATSRPPTSPRRATTCPRPPSPPWPSTAPPTTPAMRVVDPTTTERRRPARRAVADAGADPRRRPPSTPPAADAADRAADRAADAAHRRRRPPTPPAARRPTPAEA